MTSEQCRTKSQSAIRNSIALIPARLNRVFDGLVAVAEIAEDGGELYERGVPLDEAFRRNLSANDEIERPSNRGRCVVKSTLESQLVIMDSGRIEACDGVLRAAAEEVDRGRLTAHRDGELPNLGQSH